MIFALIKLNIYMEIPVRETKAKYNQKLKVFIEFFKKLENILFVFWFHFDYRFLP